MLARRRTLFSWTFSASRPFPVLDVRATKTIFERKQCQFVQEKVWELGGGGGEGGEGEEGDLEDSVCVLCVLRICRAAADLPCLASTEDSSFGIVLTLNVVVVQVPLFWVFESVPRTLM